MDGLLDFYAAIAICSAYAIPFLLVAWAVESWWVSLPYHKRRNIIRKIGGK